MEEIRDQYGRTFRTLRVSLLNHCNLGCVYCVSGEEEVKERNSEGDQHRISTENLLGIICRLHERLQLKTVRLTGGEPLLYPGLVRLIGGLRAAGIPQVRLTTNGFLLERLAAPLKEAGLDTINVSLDAVDEAVFSKMSRRSGVARILRGIDAALAAGLSLKLNTVVMKGINEFQILPLLELAMSRKIRNRFLEVMAMGHLHDQPEKYLVSQEAILARIGERYRFRPLGRGPSETAGYWQTEGGHVFGVIANASVPFCADCDRLRLDSQGNIYGCLSSNHPLPLRADDAEVVWSQRLAEALRQKQALRFTGSDLSMLDIGG